MAYNRWGCGIYAYACSSCFVCHGTGKSASEEERAFCDGMFMTEDGEAFIAHLESHAKLGDFDFDDNDGSVDDVRADVRERAAGFEGAA